MLHKEILDTNKVVFLTDSRSGIEALKNRAPKHQSYIVNNIKQKAYSLSDTMEVTIQWLPSHVGLMGNEEVDNIAKQAHNLQQSTDAVIDTSEIKLLISRAQQERWQRIYDLHSNNLHIGPIKPKIQSWPWASVRNRRVETTLIRLRLGHAGLNNHLHRFGMSETPLCLTCRVPETTKHFLSDCRKYIWSRRKMLTKLSQVGVQNPNYIVLLGGGPYDIDVQAKIVRAMESYLSETGMLGNI